MSDNEMIRKTPIRFAAALLALWMVAHPCAMAEQDIPAELPRPDATAPDTTKPIKVFILSGQSNMVGFGNVSESLTSVVKEKKMFQNLVDDQGNWTTRNDVQYLYNLGNANKTLPLSVHANGHDRIGPELQFGHYMGWLHDEVVLVIKACCCRS